jgi:ribosomal protein S18 acetylase RimI-like enzyme
MIRELRHGDEAHRCARFMSNSEPWLTLKRTYGDSLKIFSDPSKEVHVAIAGDELAGFIILQMTGAFVGYIQSIAVLPDWRNKGIGYRLMRFAEKRVFAETPNVFICVSSFNQEAQAFYKGLGYGVVGELKDYIISGHSEILLRKTMGSLTDFMERPEIA